MRYYCGECGKEIPENADFCYSCGCLKDKAVAMDDGGRMHNVCPHCGSTFRFGDAYCGSCGGQLPTSDHPSSVNLRIPSGYDPKTISLSFLLALIPGFLNIFGLGHLVLKQYSRGAMFLVISLVIWYLNGWTFQPNTFFIVMLTVAIFFYQTLDILRIINTPSE